MVESMKSPANPKTFFIFVGKWFFIFGEEENALRVYGKVRWIQWLFDIFFFLARFFQSKTSRDFVFSRLFVVVGGV